MMNALMCSIDAVIDAFQVWSGAPLHEQWLRRQALDGLVVLASDVFADARDLSRSPGEWAQAWHLVTPAGTPAPWVVAAVTLDRDAAAFFTTPATIWCVPFSDVTAALDAPVFPDDQRRRQVGHARWSTELDAWKDAIQQADQAAPTHLVNRTADGNLKRDLLMWADAVIRETGRTPSAWPKGIDRHHGDRARLVRNMSARLGLRPPRGRGRRRNT